MSAVLNASTHQQMAHIEFFVIIAHNEETESIVIFYLFFYLFFFAVMFSF